MAVSQNRASYALQRVQAVLASAPFFTALALLLANDLWLKRTYPGFVSGKLSDFSGLAVVGMLATAAFPRRRVAAYLAIGALFTWWKSPLSDTAISWLSSIGPFTFARVVDGSDLAALLILPVCGPVADRAAGVAGTWSAMRRALCVPVGAAALVAIMGTSVAMTRQDYSIRPARPADPFDHARVEQIIADVAAANRMERRGSGYEGDGMEMKYRFDERGGVTFEITARATGLFFAKRGDAKADALREGLKQALGSEIGGLEFVVPLQGGGGCRISCPRFLYQ